MHRCLELEEILRYTFEFLIADRQGPQRRSLANLAITCRTFLRPALETLWFHLPSLAPLLMCLPEDAWEQRKDPNNWMVEGPTLFIKRALVAADWERAQLYAHFVKSCCPQPESYSKLVHVDAGVFRALRIYDPNTPILPNIRVLAWNPHEDNEPDLDLFLTINLLEFSSLRATPGMLASLKKTCNRLRKLDLHMIRTSMDYESDPDLTSAISDLVPHLPSLDTMISPVPLNDDAIVHLSTSRNLQMLDIPTDVADFLRPHETNTPYSILPNLATLCANLQDLTSLISLLVQCRLKNLRCLILTIRHMEVHDVEQLFVELAGSCSHDVFQSLTILTSADPLINGNPASLHPFPARVLKHLLVFRQLRHLRLDLSFDLDDNSVEQMAENWRRLRKMVTNFPTTPDSRPKITLRGLISLARQCHDLRILTLALSVSSRDLTYLPPGLQQNCKITELRLADSWIDDDVDLTRVSSFLKRLQETLFPDLWLVSIDSGKQSHAWNTIKSHLVSFTSPRVIIDVSES